MATLQHLRTAIKAYPQIEEASSNTSFRMATFKIAGKGYIGVEKNGEHATFAIPEPDAKAFIEQPGTKAEPITKAGTLIGVRVNLAGLTVQQVEALVKMVSGKARTK